MELKEALRDAEAALKNLDAAIAATVKEMSKHTREEIDRELAAQEASHEAAVAELEKKLRDLEDAEELYDAVYSTESKGVLDTASPLKRLAFEKLAERWDSLTNAELDDLEALLDGKLNYL